ncbi:hypothetical protein Ae201684_001333 [Aphanomyces euteiches]|uniref:LamG-like jellyroll fold domain-containing protein n=1 Tax=Aphanomyces euteiches TaxID=100861 RepID=A0A6G0XTV7_9STRA|nr:hypothetical protein Ae201684_001333 [Aphanomyces euteiches]KAH9140889.1 hypothetical protein AeRB84_014902 [Aphanomyces euteiches]
MWSFVGPIQPSPGHVQLMLVNVDDSRNIIVDSDVVLEPILIDEIQHGSDLPASQHIMCEFDTTFCVPKVISMIVPNRPDGVLMAGDVLEIEFDVHTNQPPVTTKSDLEAILEFPDTLGDQIVGSWKSPLLLVLHIISIQNELWIRNITRTPVVRRAPDRWKTWHFKSTEIMYRIASAGHFAWRISHDGIPHQTDYDSPTIEVRSACPLAKIVLSAQAVEDKEFSKPTLQVKGIIALDSVHFLQFPHSSVVTDGEGSWSMLWWLYVTQDATGRFRTLFYKGTGSDQHRTPSAWFEPQSRKLILRVSTELDMDVGMTSIGQVPLHVWTLLGVTFQNHSEPIKNKTFTYTLYINGRVDTDMHVQYSEVIPNSGNLYFGGNPWMDGIQGLMANFRLFSTVLTTDEVLRVYLQELGSMQSRLTIPGQIASLSSMTAKVKSPQQFSFELIDHRSTKHVDTKALIENGFACLEGTYPFAANSTKAAMYFEEAFRHGEYSAAKILGLIYSIHDDAQDVAVALFHLAASHGDLSAMMILARRYTLGDGVQADKETAVFYYYQSAVDSARAYHIRGEQPLHEMNSLFHADEINVAEGEEGENDKWIQFQKLRADQDGEIDAMVAMGDLYYWGARGCPRDHVQAFQYFERAARLESSVAMSAAAGMLLKGEGVTQDNETAIQWYERAAKHNDVRALNGLGYIHFYGTANCTQNQTKGLEYFERAAAQRTDGDSIFNTGYCHYLGLGTDQNVSKALVYFEDAAKSFGHFDSIFELGKAAMNIDGLHERRIDDALLYLGVASAGGDWGKVARQGFDAYLKKQYDRAIWKYHEAREYGYEVAAGNLAYLYGLVGKNSSKYLLEAKEKEASLRLGDCYYYGKGGVSQDFDMALVWYSRASADGLSVGAYNVGYMTEYGIGCVPADAMRAKRYYERALELSPTWEAWFVISVSIYRLQIRSWFGLTPGDVEFQPATSPPKLNWDDIGLGSICIALAGVWSLQHLRNRA